METTVRKEIQALRKMTVSQLRQKHAEVFGEETRSHHKQHLFRRIAWRIQALAEGGLSERARRRALEIANDADLRVRAPKTAFQQDVDFSPNGAVNRPLGAESDPRLPAVGEEIVRDYKGRSIVVRVLERRFEYDGKIRKSLSAIAREVTGTKWNGYLFFGLHVSRVRSKSQSQRAFIRMEPAAGERRPALVSCLDIGHRGRTPRVLAIYGELRRMRSSRRRGHPGTASVCTGVAAVRSGVVGRTTNSGACRR